MILSINKVGFFRNRARLNNFIADENIIPISLSVTQKDNRTNFYLLYKNIVQ